MIIKLDRSITNIKPVKLNKYKSFSAEGNDVTLIGFGYTTNGVNPSDVLLDTKAKAVNYADCNAVYQTPCQDVHDDIMIDNDVWLRVQKRCM
jgi:hypothetical protein